MLRAEKAKVIDDLHGVFSASEIVVVTHYKGLSVPEITDLRRQVRGAGASFNVTKNRLAKLAVEGTSFEPLRDLFVGPTAIACSSDPVAAAKVVVDFAKKNDKLVLVGGGFGGNILSPDQVRALSSLPSLDELRAKILSLLNTPASRLVGLLQAPGGQMARVLKAYAEKA
ncbi:50S ribosomal protein L10 [Marinivivus vitaminiproducens]|uniref:50S ribosomal protein L10 n=1 Tax=Marinivivus vitaminiproducens TaxID=3035935 RepID=UPI00279B4E25|nr:50S ribosomal protein L10 [Geminicoccaceae bacterium SCSIO 64248]